MSDERTEVLLRSSNNSGLREEGIITTHEIFKCFDREKRSLDILHSDIFSNSRRVVISGLNTIGELGDKKSILYISKFFNHKDGEIRNKAIHAAGMIKDDSAKDTLIKLFKLRNDEDFRLEILDALLKRYTNDTEVVSLLKAFISSNVISDHTKAQAIRLLLDTDPGIRIRDILHDFRPGTETFRAILEKIESINDNSWVVEQILKNFHRISVDEKKLLPRLALPFDTPDKIKLLVELLMDIQPEVRRSCYEVISEENKSEAFGKIIEFMIDGVESDPNLEELARNAILKFIDKKWSGLSQRVIRKIEENIHDLYQEIRKSENRITSDSHELGWFIVHSKEYLEYYGDEDLKQAIVGYLKGSGNYTQDELLREVKTTAVKVEVRHFEGYNALLEIIKNPKRPGVALIARELALVKTGKRRIMYRLIRNLYSTVFFDAKSMSTVFVDIYEWARKQKLFRLAEAALYALNNTDRKRTFEAIKENITPPIQSKILAIASLRLIKYYNWSDFEDIVLHLFDEANDVYLTNNIIDCILQAPDLKSISRLTILNRFTNENDDEIVTRLAGILQIYFNNDILEGLIKVYSSVSDKKRRDILKILRWVFGKGKYYV